MVTGTELHACDCLLSFSVRSSISQPFTDKSNTSRYVIHTHKAPEIKAFSKEELMNFKSKSSTLFVIQTHSQWRVQLGAQGA